MAMGWLGIEEGQQGMKSNTKRAVGVKEVINDGCRKYQGICEKVTTLEDYRTHIIWIFGVKGCQ